MLHVRICAGASGNRCPYRDPLDSTLADRPQFEEGSLPWACQEHGTALHALWFGQSDDCRQTTWGSTQSNCVFSELKQKPHGHSQALCANLARRTSQFLLNQRFLVISCQFQWQIKSSTLLDQRFLRFFADDPTREYVLIDVGYWRVALLLHLC